MQYPAAPGNRNRCFGTTLPPESGLSRQCYGEVVRQDWHQATAADKGEWSCQLRGRDPAEGVVPRIPHPVEAVDDRQMIPHAFSSGVLPTPSGRQYRSFAHLWLVSRGVSSQALVYVRSGRFSGSAISLLREMRRRMDVEDIDTQTLGYDRQMAFGRIRAKVGVRRTRGVPCSRTGAWVDAVEGRVQRLDLPTTNAPVLFVQTVNPVRLGGEGHPYFVCTDRVASEGASTGGPFRSRHSEDWRVRERAFLRGASSVFVMGPSTKAVLCTTEYEISEDRVEVVGAGPNCALGGPRAAGGQCRGLLFVGTQWELKGGPELLEAFAHIRDRYPDAKLALVGSAPNGDVPPGVASFGKVESWDMDRFYSWADAVVIPTFMETFGISLVEAILKGLPCVGTTVGNQEWIIGEAGLCVEPGNVEALTQAIDHLIGDYPSFQQLALQRRGLHDSVTWGSVADAITRRARNY